jgi:hypothetical protein
VNQPTPEDNYTTTLYAIWAVQDSLLQSYRSSFLTSESLLIGLAVSGIANQKFAWLLIGVGTVLWFVWGLVTRARARDVRFVQELLKKDEEGKRVRNPFSTFKAYQEAWQKNGAYSIQYVDQEIPFLPPPVWPPRDIPLHRFWRWGTRIHMEVTLPFAFLVGWTVVAFYATQP